MPSCVSLLCSGFCLNHCASENQSTFILLYRGILHVVKRQYHGLNTCFNPIIPIAMWCSFVHCTQLSSACVASHSLDWVALVGLPPAKCDRSHSFFCSCKAPQLRHANTTVHCLCSIRSGGWGRFKCSSAATPNCKFK